MFDGSDRSVLDDYDHLLLNKKRKFNMKCPPDNEIYTSPKFINVEFSYKCKCRRGSCRHEFYDSKDKNVIIVLMINV